MCSLSLTDLLSICSLLNPPHKDKNIRFATYGFADTVFSDTEFVRYGIIRYGLSDTEFPDPHLSDTELSDTDFPIQHFRYGVPVSVFLLRISRSCFFRFVFFRFGWIPTRNVPDTSPFRYGCLACRFLAP